MGDDMSYGELYRKYHWRTFKIHIVFLLIIAIAAIPVLGISYLYCEHLTKQYAGDIRADILSEVVPSGETLAEFKVLRYKDGLIPEASVYVVTERGSSQFRRQQETVYHLYHRYGQWNIEESGGTFAWPYSLIPDFDFSFSIGP